MLTSDPDVLISDWEVSFNEPSIFCADPRIDCNEPLMSPTCPGSVVDGVHRLMAAMDLVYGALDFVIEKDTGRWVFLEINAGGQFGFIEDETGAPLIAQLADLLTERKQ